MFKEVGNAGLGQANVIMEKKTKTHISVKDLPLSYIQSVQERQLDLVIRGHW